LVEANALYIDVFELQNTNNYFSNTDVSCVTGENDVINHGTKTDKTSHICGMPILVVEKSKSALFVKRSLSFCYAGVDNQLFYKDNILILSFDAQKKVKEISKSLD